MKYLVNRETKEHITWPDDVPATGMMWEVVEADAEGWIKWDGVECPLPYGVRVDVKHRDGSIWSDYGAESEDWNHDDIPQDTVAYRPILDKPTVKESLAVPAPEYDPRSVSFNLLDRLKSAHEAAQTIPDLLSELREALGPELIRMIVDVPDYKEGMSEIPSDIYKDRHLPGERIEPDMSDWRNWRDGDLLVCIKKDSDHCDDFLIDEVYEMKGISMSQWVCCKIPTAKHGYNELPPDHFRFHSRP